MDKEGKMFCEQCGAQMPDGSSFCESCGASVQAAGPKPGQQPGGYRSPGVTPPPSGMYQQQPASRYTSRAGQYGSGGSVFAGEQAKSMMFAGIAAVSGFMVFISTFLGWLRPGANVTLSGWQFVAGGTFVDNWVTGMKYAGVNISSNFLFWSGPKGLFWFTGIWTLLLGLGIIACVVLFFLQYRQGAVIAASLGSLCALIAVVNLVMASTIWGEAVKVQYSYVEANYVASAGLYVLAVFAIAAAVFGALAFKYSE